MTDVIFQNSDNLRRDFSDALSEMYRLEVPAYGTLIDIVADINKTFEGDDARKIRSGGERHGAIRLGTAEELNLIGRVFAVLGLHPVGYYDLSVAGLPVHSTAFRPITDASFAISPFRMFTSLLRLDMIEDEALRDAATNALETRNIFSREGRRLLDKAEAHGGLDSRDGAVFIREAVAIFAWRPEAHIDHGLYKKLKTAHGLIADIVSFKGPHMNHLTPRVADIDAAQSAMAEAGLDIKDTIEGPPRRNCPILLRQTAFKALTESVRFQDGENWVDAQHTARFGEIEQRGAALTPAGRALYDACLTAKDFTDFPDDWDVIREQDLAYFDASGAPLTYEDFLPVSAAGIFRSNLRDGAPAVETLALVSKGSGNQDAFEQALGRPVLDMFALYQSARV